MPRITISGRAVVFEFPEGLTKRFKGWIALVGNVGSVFPLKA